MTLKMRCVVNFCFFFIIPASQYLLPLSLLLLGASDTADTLFQEVLGRKDKADSTRNALNVLQRFKFLFNLPLNIERNIQKVKITAESAASLCLCSTSST